MTKVKGLEIGARYGRLTILGESERRQVGNKGLFQRYEKCKCDCGNIVWVNKGSLKKGHTKSCGCLGTEHRLKCGTINKKHGDYNTRLYRIFYDMKQRCDNPKNDRYYYYGGRGIKCLWDKYEDFKADMNEGYIIHCSKFGENNTTIDRINVDGDYCKENCRWSTRIEQQRNVRGNRLFEWGGEMLTIREIWEKSKTDIGYSTVVYRVYVCGRDIKDAITKPLVHGRTNFNSVKNT